MSNHRSPQSIDGASKEVQREWLDIERTRQQTRDALIGRSLYSGYVSARPELSIANPERQHGRALLAHLFIERVRKLDCSLVWKIVPHLSDSAQLSYPGPDGNLILACYTQALIMPEWSIVEPYFEDLPTLETTVEPDTPLINREQTSGREVVRGWRTVLAKLILHKRITLTQAEKEFGPGDRASWAILTGKAKRRNELVA